MWDVSLLWKAISLLRLSLHDHRLHNFLALSPPRDDFNAFLKVPCEKWNLRRSGQQPGDS